MIIAVNITLSGHFSASRSSAGTCCERNTSKGHYTSGGVCGETLNVPVIVR
jgi:hypothetical protein